MIQVTCEIEPDLVGELEEHLCSWEVSPWALVVNRITGEGSLDGYFAGEQEAKTAWASLRDVFLELPEAPKVSLIEDRDWQEAYKEHFHPWKTGSLHLVPAWEREGYDIPAEHKAVYLDPGMAFGTGNHETTRLCLKALIGFVTDNSKNLMYLSCVDAGCGSGILALAAKVLGFGEVRGFDLDSNAVRIAEENATENGLSNQVDFACADLASALQPECADLLLANVQADVLCEHRVALLTALRPRGTLCLSGVLSKEVEEVERVFVAEAKRMSVSISSQHCLDEQWAALALRGDC